MIPEYLSPLANHLWQSTLVFAVTALFGAPLAKKRRSCALLLMVHRRVEVSDSFFVTNEYRPAI